MKMVFCRYVLAVIILGTLAFLGLSAEEQKQKITFFRPSEPGNVISCEIEVESKSVMCMTSGDGTVNEKATEVNISISGILTVKKVTEYGQSAQVEFKVDRMKGALNGKEIKSSVEGKVIEINQDSDPCTFRIKDSDDELSREEMALLSQVFKKARKENMADYIGTENEIGIGDSWKTPHTPLLGDLRKRKFKEEDCKIEGEVKLVDKKNLNGYECWLFNADLKASKDEEFVFEFKVEVALPVDGKTGAISVKRSGYQKVVARDSNPMVPDVKEISLTFTEKRGQTMVPVQKGEGIAK